MARNREAVILVLDVGPSMHRVLPEVEKVCSLLVQKKLIFGKSDEVGIVLFGTEDTDNELEREVGGYGHVVVLQNIKVVDGDTVEVLKHLPRGTASGDFMDAIVVGMDMLIKKFRSTNKGKQRLCLITDAQCPIKEPEEGTKEYQVNTVSQQMKVHGMKLDCIVIREVCGGAPQRILDENDHLLNLFPRNTTARVVHINSPTSLLGALVTRNISPVTVYRGDLELSPIMKIKVWVYKKTSEEKFPTLKKYSDKAPQSDKSATHEVKVDYEYRSMNDHDKVVPPEQRIKGYRYGPQVVPISSAEWEAVKFKPDKSVKLLGFTDASNITRHYFMKDVYVFIPEPGNGKAIVAISAIARAMKEMGKVAILRCVWRQGQANVIVGVLTPNISSRDNMPDSFYFNVLPFAEDVREFQFPSFSSFPLSMQPNQQQQEAADNLIKMLDLAPSDREEVLRADYTPNPVLERFYRSLDLKSKQSDANVAPLDSSLKRMTEPDPELLSQYKPVLENIQKQFDLKENPKKKKSSRRAWREKLSVSNEGRNGANGEASDILTITSIKGSPELNIEKISDLNPVQDFEAMIARRDSSKWVRKAIKEMQHYITNLLENSYEGDAYPKAIECLLALRKGCILEQGSEVQQGSLFELVEILDLPLGKVARRVKMFTTSRKIQKDVGVEPPEFESSVAQEPKEFNRFLQDIHERWKTTDLANFFGFLLSKNITLISKAEALDSDVTEEEAKDFPIKTELR